MPLIEIVSEPDMRSAEQAGAYLRVLKQILEYVDVSDVNMEEGSLRVDANVSARRRGETKLGTKTEVKNMNSFSGVERALEVEFARQVGVLEAGGTIEQQTMLWDGTRGQVRPARIEGGQPRLPLLPRARSAAARARDRLDRRRSRDDLPELPAARRARFADGLRARRVRRRGAHGRARASPTTSRPSRARTATPKAAANWVMGEVLATLKTSGEDIARFRVRPADLASLLDLVRDGIVSHTAAKQIFARMVATGDPPAQIAEREGLVKVDDDAQLAAWLDEVLAENPAEAERYRRREEAAGRAVGAVMKKSKGRADPKKLNQLLDGAARVVERRGRARARSRASRPGARSGARPRRARARRRRARSASRRTCFARRSASSPDGSSAIRSRPLELASGSR